MTTTQQTSGTVRVLFCGIPESDPVFLSWDGTPRDAHRYTGEWGLESLEFGDYDCDSLPSEPPEEPGLWLLRWDWQMVPHPDADECGDDRMTTAKYAATCEWRRPTLAELAELNVYPGTPRGPHPARPGEEG